MKTKNIETICRDRHCEGLLVRLKQTEKKIVESKPESIIYHFTNGHFPLLVGVEHGKAKKALSQNFKTINTGNQIVLMNDYINSFNIINN